MPPLEVKIEKKKANEQSFKFNKSAETRVLFLCCKRGARGIFMILFSFVYLNLLDCLHFWRCNDSLWRTVGQKWKEKMKSKLTIERRMNRFSREIVLCNENNRNFPVVSPNNVNFSRHRSTNFPFKVCNLAN